MAHDVKFIEDDPVAMSPADRDLVNADSPRRGQPRQLSLMME
jgi:hypothetical protein